MTIEVFSPTGQKGKQMTLPASLFGQDVNYGLMHQAVVRQQSNRRQSAAHVLTRSEVSGSTKKLFSQKHTGRARRGDIRSPTLRGGGKAFGPRNEKNFEKDMPRKMRHAALRSCLSLHAQKGTVVGLEGYGETIKTKTLKDILAKMAIKDSRSLLIISKDIHRPLVLSARNLPGITVVSAPYLNAESVLHARSLVFLSDAIPEADKLFGKHEKGAKTKKLEAVKEEKPVAKKKAPAKKPAKKKAPAKK